MVDRLDYGTLLHHTHTGALAEDAVDTSDVVSFSGSDQGYVIHRVEIFPPLVAGVIENLTVQILVDGTAYDGLHLHSRSCPPILSNSKWLGISLGIPESNNAIENTCLKGNSKIQVKCYGGKDGVSADYEIKLRGYYIESDAAAKRLLGSTFNLGGASRYERMRGNRISINRATPVTIENLDDLCAGVPRAAKPRVLPFVNFAWNANATTKNTGYPYSATLKNVAKDWEEMEFDFDKSTALLITHLAALEVANSKSLYIKIGEREWPKEHFDIGQFTNEIPFSTFDDELPIQEYPLLIHDETGTLHIVDDGTSIGANTLMVGIWGKKFELA